ncbi:MAG: ATP-binding cassette domain-containing protein [Trueperaceae bacterium]
MATAEAAAAAVASGEPTLHLRKLHKAFGGVVAIQEYSLDLYPGEIVALVGDNGAGKSTLVKMISGVYQPTSGQMFLDGEEVTLSSASSARDLGIEVVYQDLALADNQPVYMNMFLGRELSKGPFGRLDRPRMISETETQVRDLDVRIPSAQALVLGLSGGQRQGIAIARATHWASKLVLMDEPTAALGVAETAKVESIIQSLRARNLAILVVSHNLDQVFRISDRVSVLRRGVQVGERETSSVDKNEIVSMITGLG